VSSHDPASRPDEHDVLRLDDALKLAGVVATGGQAKQLIHQGAVTVNGEVETRRKRKLVEGDVVEVGGESFEIALADDDEETEGDEGEDDSEAEALHLGTIVGFEDEDDEVAVRLDDTELERWSSWVVERAADDDLEAVILRLGSLHPEALEALFAHLPADVEDAVLDALDDVLDAASEDAAGAPLQA
jgi:ribosome-associated protein